MKASSGGTPPNIADIKINYSLNDPKILPRTGANKDVLTFDLPCIRASWNNMQGKENGDGNTVLQV